ncbi:hypothetical protein FRC18_003723 [Serendipita sp. 400]|nr:hypothetical protein FRC18_003723 [Serendipita sp. 400]
MLDYEEDVAEKASRRRSREPVVLPASKGKHGHSQSMPVYEHDINPYGEQGPSPWRGAMSWFKGLVKAPQQLKFSSGDNDGRYSTEDRYSSAHDPSHSNRLVSHKSRSSMVRDDQDRRSRRVSVPEGDPYAERQVAYADPSRHYQSRHHRHRSDDMGYSRPEERRSRHEYGDMVEHRESRRERRSVPMGDEGIERGRTLSRERANSRFKNHQNREHDRRREIPQGDGMYTIEHSQPLTNLTFEGQSVQPAQPVQPMQTPHPIPLGPPIPPPTPAPPASNQGQNQPIFGSPVSNPVPLMGSPETIAGAEITAQMGGMTLQDGPVKASSPTSYSEAGVYRYDPDVPPVVRRPRGDSIRSILKPPSSASSFLNLPGDGERVAIMPAISRSPSPVQLDPRNRHREEARREEGGRYVRSSRRHDEPGAVLVEYPDGSRYRGGARSPQNIQQYMGRSSQRPSASGSVEYHYSDPHRGRESYDRTPQYRDPYAYSRQSQEAAYYNAPDPYRDNYRSDGRRYAIEQPGYYARDPYEDAGYGSSRRRGNAATEYASNGQYYPSHRY